MKGGEEMEGATDAWFKDKNKQLALSPALSLLLLPPPPPPPFETGEEDEATPNMS